MHVALYARVSTGRQEREQTIASQLTALRAWVAEQGHEVSPDHIYCDEGGSLVCVHPTRSIAKHRAERP